MKGRLLAIIVILIIILACSIDVPPYSDERDYANLTHYEKPETHPDDVAIDMRFLHNRKYSKKYETFGRVKEKK